MYMKKKIIHFDAAHFAARKPICGSLRLRLRNTDHAELFSSSCVEKNTLEADHTSNFSILTAVNAEGNTFSFFKSSGIKNKIKINTLYSVCSFIDCQASQKDSKVDFNSKN
jgi:hypothetical protein